MPLIGRVFKIIFIKENKLDRAFILLRSYFVKAEYNLKTSNLFIIGGEVFFIPRRQIKKVI